MFDSAIARARDDHPAGALELDAVGAALLEHPDRARDRLLVRDLVRAERQVADHERPVRRAGHRAREEDHLVERHRHGRLVAEHHHRRRVADEHELDARLVRQPRGRRVVGGDHRRSGRRGASSRASSGSAQLPGRGRRRAGVRGRVLIGSPSSRTLSIRRVEPTRAATASVGPSRSATATYSGSIPASARMRARATGVAGRERARDRERARRARRRKAGVARGEREAVGVAHGRDDADLELEVQVADELLHDRDLLRVLAAEVRDVGPDDREQLQAHGRDAAEVAGPVPRPRARPPRPRARPRSRTPADRTPRPPARTGSRRRRPRPRARRASKSRG